MRLSFKFFREYYSVYHEPIRTGHDINRIDEGIHIIRDNLISLGFVLLQYSIVETRAVFGMFNDNTKIILVTEPTNDGYLISLRQFGNEMNLLWFSNIETPEYFRNRICPQIIGFFDRWDIGHISDMSVI